MSIEAVLTGNASLKMQVNLNYSLTHGSRPGNIYDEAIRKMLQDRHICLNSRVNIFIIRPSGFKI